MKGVRPFRLAMLTVATLAAAMLWMPMVLAISFPHPLAADPFLFMGVGRVWWSVQALCSLLTFALTAVAVMRRDFISIFGFASALIVFFGTPILLMAISWVF